MSRLRVSYIPNISFISIAPNDQILEIYRIPGEIPNAKFTEMLKFYSCAQNQIPMAFIQIQKKKEKEKEKENAKEEFKSTANIPKELPNKPIFKEETKAEPITTKPNEQHNIALFISELNQLTKGDGVIELIIRLPNGNKLTQLFKKAHKIRDIYEYAKYTIKNQEASIVLSSMHRPLKVLENTIESEGIEDKTMIQVSEI